MVNTPQPRDLRYEPPDMQTVNDFEKQGVRFELTSTNATVNVPPTLRGKIDEGDLRCCVAFLYSKQFGGVTHSNPVFFSYSGPQI